MPRRLVKLLTTNQIIVPGFCSRLNNELEEYNEILMPQRDDRSARIVPIALHGMALATGAQNQLLVGSPFASRSSNSDVTNAGELCYFSKSFPRTDIFDDAFKMKPSYPGATFVRAGTRTPHLLSSSPPL